MFRTYTQVQKALLQSSFYVGKLTILRVRSFEFYYDKPTETEIKRLFSSHLKNAIYYPKHSQPILIHFVYYTVNLPSVFLERV